MKLTRIAVIAIITAGALGLSTVAASAAVLLGSGNWSGYLAQARPGYKIGQNTTKFNVPTLDCAATRGKNANSAQRSNNGTVIWGGIDGVSLAEGDVEQDGVWLWCDKYSHPHYQTFWEMAPAPPHYLWDVHPGDTIASITKVTSPNHYLLELTDFTHRHQTLMNAYARVLDISTESIVEVPSRSTFLAKYRGSVGIIADSWAEPLPTDRQVPYWGSTPWTIPHELTLMRGRTLLAQPSNASEGFYGLSRFSVTARAS